MSCYIFIFFKDDYTSLYIYLLQLVGRNFDVMDDDAEASSYYETIYSLLDSISPEYRNTFGDTLAQKLQGLQDLQQTPESEES